MQNYIKVLKPFIKKTLIKKIDLNKNSSFIT